MLARRIIPCLDVKEGQVVKGIQFRNHQVMGDIITLAQFYSEVGADELVFYDITASSEARCVDYTWVERVALCINIPFCVAGGIRSIKQAEAILHAGADKISLNSPALETPQLIDELAAVFGSQCVVIGIDSLTTEEGYRVCQYTGDTTKTRQTSRSTLDWILEIQQRGAGEVVVNCMNQDGMRLGYDLTQLKQIRAISQIPVIASGGAGTMLHFAEVFKQAQVDGALAATVFHSKTIDIPTLKNFLHDHEIEVRL